MEPTHWKALVYLNIEERSYIFIRRMVFENTDPVLLRQIKSLLASGFFAIAIRDWRLILD